MTSFVAAVERYAGGMAPGTPPIVVAHPAYGLLGEVSRERGFVPARGVAVRAILRDARRGTVRLLRNFDKYAPAVARAVAAAALSAVSKDPYALPVLLGVISNYDGIVAARGSGALQDVWMSMTATQTPVTLSWYDLMSFASWQPATAPTITAYTNAGTGGAVSDATSNGSWLANPQGTNKKYIASVGLTASSITGFSLAMLYDQLWAGQYVITANATINPTTDVAVTRYASTTPGDADYAGGNQMMMSLASTLTITTPGTVTTSYTDGKGGTGKTSIWVPGPTGALVNRVVGNTTHNTATVITSTPFMPLTNAGTPGVTKLEQVAIAGGTIGAGTINHKIVRPLILMPFIAANSFIEQDATLNIGNMVELRNVSQVCGCLGWNAFSAGTTAVSFSAFLRTVEG